MSCSHRAARTLALLFAVAAAGCADPSSSGPPADGSSSGDGADGPTSAAGDASERGPLRLLSTTPNAGASGIDRDTFVELTFDRAVDAGTAAAAVTLSSPTEQIPVEVVVDDSVVRARPLRRLAPTSAYRIEIASSITDRDRVPLSAAVTIAFTTRARTWHEPEVLAVGAVSPSVTVDAAGRVLATFDVGDALGSALFVPGAGGGWSDVPPVERGVNYGDAVVGEDGGRRVASWTRSNDVWWSRYEPGRGWTDKALFADTFNRTFSALPPRFAMASGGRGIAVWYGYEDAQGTQPGGRARVFSADGELGPVTRISEHEPRAVVYDGDVGLAHVGLDPSNTDALLVRSYADGVWSAPVNVNIPTGDGLYYASLAFGRQGRAFALWGTNFPVQVYLRSFTTADRTWQAAVRVPTGTQRSNEAPVVVGDRDGSAVIAWTQGSNQTLYRVHSVRWTVDRGFVEARPLEPSDGAARQHSQELRMATSGHGQVLACWRREIEERTRRYQVWGAMRDGDTWLDALPMEPEPQAGSSGTEQAACAVGASGDAVVVYLRYGDQRRSVVARRYD